MSASASRVNGTGSSAGCHHTTRDESPPSTVTARDLSDYLEAARVRLGIQVKAIAFWWDCDHGYVSRVLAGKDKLTDECFARLKTHDDDGARVLYAATLIEACTDAGITTGRRAHLQRALEGLTAFALADPRLDVPVHMVKCTLSEDAR